MRFPVLLCGVFALGAVSVPVHYPTSAGYPGKAGKDMVVPYFPAANYLPGMQVSPGSADVNTANAMANMMLASISNGNSGAVSTGTAYGSTAAGSTIGTSNGNGVNMGTGSVNYFPMNTIGFDIAVPNTGTPVNSNGASSVNAGVPSLNMNNVMIDTSRDGNVNNNVNSGFGRSNNNRNLNLDTNNNGFNNNGQIFNNNNGFNFNNNNNEFSFNGNNNGFNFNINGLNFNSNGFNVNNNGINTNGFNLNNIGSANSNRNSNGYGAKSIMNADGTVGDINGAAPGANNAANVMVMVPMPDTSGNVQNGNQLMTGNGQTGNVVTGTVPANGPMSGMGMLVHGPDCNIPGQSGNGNAGSNGNTGATNGANMVPVFAKGNAYAGTTGNGQVGKY